MLAPVAKAKTEAKATPAPVSWEAIDRLPAAGWRTAPAFAANERAGKLLALGFPWILLTTAGGFTGSDQELRALAVRSRMIPRDELARFYKLYAGDNCATVELPAAVAHLLAMSGNHFAIFALEQLFGSVAVATAFVDALAATPIASWNDKLGMFGPGAIRNLGFVLWRVPAKARDELRARLQTIYDGLVAADQGNRLHTKAIDVILHGRAAVERVIPPGHKIFADLVYADDDPAWVAKTALARLAKLKPADLAQFDIQIAVAGGPEVVAALREGTAKFKPEQAPIIAAQLSLV